VRLLAVVAVLVVAVAAIATANAVLLGHGSERSDRVGRLSPVGRQLTTPSPERPPTTTNRTTTEDDDHGGRGGHDDRGVGDLDD